MASNSGSPQKEEINPGRHEGDLAGAQGRHRVLMPREYYDIKHPWFGSQIHYTIDVLRQLIKDARNRKQASSKDGG